MRLFTLSSTVLILLISGSLAVASDPQSKGPLPFVDSDGTIRFPGRVRDGWVHLGSWGSADLNSADPGQHDVYTQPESLEAYRKTGKFPDGAVLVKELLKAKTDSMTTGEISYAAETEGWFVMIKDTEGRFKGNKLWGRGWGWSLFNAEDPTKAVTEDFKTECIPCHVPAKKDDWIYVRGYPALTD